MTSIFIWKSNDPIISDTTVTYYNGSDWFLEEYSSHNGNNSKSYQYVNQKAFSTSLYSTVMYFEMKEMPCDWVGHHLLEKYNNLPYVLLKEDDYAIFDQIGIWKRCKKKGVIDFDEKELEQEWNNIQKWINEPLQQQSKKYDMKMDTKTKQMNSHYLKNRHPSSYYSMPSYHSYNNYNTKYNK
jgi:hypothetical protein